MGTVEWKMRVWTTRLMFLLLFVPIRNRRRKAIEWGSPPMPVRCRSGKRPHVDVVDGIRVRLATLAQRASRFERLLTPDEGGSAVTGLGSMHEVLEQYLHDALAFKIDTRELSQQTKLLIAALQALQPRLPPHERDRFDAFLTSVREWVDVMEWIVIHSWLVMVGFLVETFPA